MHRQSSPTSENHIWHWDEFDMMIEEIRAVEVNDAVNLSPDPDASM